MQIYNSHTGIKGGLMIFKETKFKGVYTVQLELKKMRVVFLPGHTAAGNFTNTEFSLILFNLTFHLISMLVFYGGCIISLRRMPSRN